MRITNVRSRTLLRHINGQVWAILPAKLEAIADFLATRANGQKVSPAEIRAITSARTDRERTNGNGVAVLPLSGTILHRSTAMQEMSGLASLEDFGRAFDAAVDNPDIATIVLRVDSPGGTVAGTPEMAQKIYEARSRKRIVAIADSLMASAAYYIGAAAHEIVATPSAEVGSLGVFHMHFDLSGALEEQGIRPTITKFGRFKAETNPYEALTDDAKAHLQETVTAYGEMFVRDVARFRSEKMKGLHERFGEGRMFVAESARAAGLIDRVATFEQLMSELGISRTQLSAARMEEQPERIAASASGTVYPEMQIVASNLTALSTDLVQIQIPTTDNTDVPEATDAGASESHDNTSASTAVPAEESTAMSTQDSAGPNAGTVTVGADALAAERKRVNDIYAACAHKLSAEQAAQFVASGASAEQVKAFLAATESRENGAIGSPPVTLTEKEEKRYSIVRAINGASSKYGTKEWQAAGFEREVAQDLARTLKRETGEFSVLVPTNLGVASRPQATLRTSSGAALGEHLVFTEEGSFIDLLRNRMVTPRMGATFLTGLQGNVSFPKQSSAGTFSWVAENPGSDVSLSDLGTTQVTLSPKEGTSRTSYARRLLAQSVINVEQLVRRDLSTIGAIGLDRAALHGTGASNQPTGIYLQSGVNTVSVEGPILWQRVVEMETAVRADNADIGTMAYVTTPEIRGDMKTTQKASSTGIFLWEGGLEGEVNGFRGFASNQISKTMLGTASTGGTNHGAIFGVWEQLLIGEWGAMELIVDPYTLAGQALVVVTMHLIADIAVRYPEAFCVATGLTRSEEQS